MPSLEDGGEEGRDKGGVEVMERGDSGEESFWWEGGSPPPLAKNLKGRTGRDEGVREGKETSHDNRA